MSGRREVTTAAETVPCPIFSRLLGWIFDGFDRVGFQRWRCVRCKVARTVTSVPDDWHCPVCRRREAG